MSSVAPVHVSQPFEQGPQGCHQHRGLSLEQLESNIDMIEQGSLPDDVVATLEAMYGEIGDEVLCHF